MMSGLPPDRSNTRATVMASTSPSSAVIRLAPSAGVRGGTAIGVTNCERDSSERKART